MKYKLRYRIRDWLFQHLFPIKAMHEAHLVDDFIHALERIKYLEGLPQNYKVETGTNDITTYVEQI